MDDNYGTVFSKRIQPTKRFSMHEMELVLDQNSNKEYSSAHCIGDNMQSDSWRGTSCLYRSVCYDVSTKEFLFFRKGDEDINGLKNVSIRMQDYKWPPNEYTASSRFAPRMVNSDIPVPHYRPADSNVLWIFYASGVALNVGHLVWDDFLPWFTLFNIFAPFLKDSKASIQPLWINYHDNPPWASCEWVKQHEGEGHGLVKHYSRLCYENYRKWLPAMLGKDAGEILETDTFLQADYQRGKLVSNLICFPNAAAGVGVLNDHCFSLHGWNPMDDNGLGDLRADSVPCVAGRGPILFEFRKHLLRMAEIEEPKPRSVPKVLVVLSMRSSTRIPYEFKETESWIKNDLDRITKDIIPKEKVEIRKVYLSQLTSKEQMRLLSRTSIFITIAGGGAMSGMFMPKGSAAIFFSSGEGSHQGRDDWAFWENSGWIRPSWFELRSASNATEIGLLKQPFLARLRHELRQCLQFMDIHEAG